MDVELKGLECQLHCHKLVRKQELTYLPYFLTGQLREKKLNRAPVSPSSPPSVALASVLSREILAMLKNCKSHRSLSQATLRHSDNFVKNKEKYIHDGAANLEKPSKKISEGLWSARTDRDRYLKLSLPHPTVETTKV